MSRIRVAVVDDQELMRSALRMMVESQDDLELVGEAADGLEAVELVRARATDIVLMDVRMPRLDGIDATRQILATRARTRVIALTTFDLDELAFAALRSGASAFLLKDSRAEDIVDAIRVVHGGQAVLAPSTTRRLIEHLTETGVLTRTDDVAALLAPLTGREAEVLRQLATGASNAEIAGRLFLSEATVKTHVGHVLAKLGLRDRVQAVVLAYESGLVRPGGSESHPRG